MSVFCWFLLHTLLGKIIAPQQVRKFPCILRNMKVQYRIHNSPSLASVLNEISPRPPNRFNIHFNIILPSTPTFYNYSLSLRSPLP